MATWKEYRYRCVTEAADILELRKDVDGTPTQCKNDAAHSIDANTVVVIESVSETNVTAKLNDNAGIDIELSDSIEDTFELTVNNAQAISTWEKVMDYPWDILMGVKDIDGDQASEDDKISFFVSPPNQGLGAGMLGFVRAVSLVNQPILAVDATTAANVKPGYFLEVGTESKKYRISSIDTTAGSETLTLTENLTVQKETTDKIGLFVASVYERRNKMGRINELGHYAWGSRNIPAGYRLRLEYQHKNTPTADGTIPFTLVYKY